jgi:hypothetical protein
MMTLLLVEGSRKASTDPEKIYLQLFLDVCRYGADVQSLGVDPQALEAFRALQRDVAPGERFLE